jgi:hypothetical protein
MFPAIALAMHSLFRQRHQPSGDTYIESKMHNAFEVRVAAIENFTGAWSTAGHLDSRSDGGANASRHFVPPAMPCSLSANPSSSVSAKRDLDMTALQGQSAA